MVNGWGRARSARTNPAGDDDRLDINVVAKERIDREVRVDAALGGQLALLTTGDRAARPEEPAHRERLALVQQVAAARVTELFVAAGPARWRRSFPHTMTGGLKR